MADESFLVPAHADIFRNGQVRVQTDVLVYDGDALFDGRIRIRDSLFCPAKTDPSTLVRAVDACQNFDQRRFPRPILANKRMHLSLSQFKIYII